MGCRDIQDHRDKMDRQEMLVELDHRDHQEKLETLDLQDHWESLVTQVMPALQDRT